MEKTKSIVGLLLPTDCEAEAEDVLSFTKTLTADQAKELDALLRGVKIGFDLATGGAIKTA